KPLHRKFPSAPTVLKLATYRRFTRPIIPDNACILCITTAAAGTELALLIPQITVPCFFSGKRSFRTRRPATPPRGIAPQAFAHCGKFPTAASRRSLGRVSVPSVADHPLGPATDHRLGSYAYSPVRHWKHHFPSDLHVHNLYPCASYSHGVRSQKYSYPYPSRQSHEPLIHSYSITAREQVKIEKLTFIGFRDNQARTDDFHHVKVTLYR
ncbi:hypothetical protein HID58_090093, partial [Brassica napus]